MEKAIRQYLNFYKHINPEFSEKELEIIITNLTFINLKKKQLYIREGKIHNSIGFMSSGLIRSYFIDQKGKEINNAFFSENEFVTDYLSFINQTKTKYNFECLEDCTLILIPYEVVEIAYKNYRNFAIFGRKIAEWALEKRTKKYESFLFENAEERYLRFIAENKAISNRISLSHLASYLGIERQSLSRIRSKILSQM